MIVVALLFAAAESTGPSAPLFQRTEPHLAKGAELLEDGEFDLALEEFRKAEADQDDERAVVEYDIGSTLMLRAIKTQPPAQEGKPHPDTSALEDARAAFERARALARNPKIKSEAALAAGNAAALAGGIDDAITAYRQALASDPTNVRARTNLRRALETKKQQQRQENEKNEKDQNEEKQGQDGKEDEKKEDEKKAPEEQEKDKEPKQQEQEEEKEKEPTQQNQEQEKEKKQEQKKQRREEARRLLDALRAREKPLTPLEMLGVKPTQPKDGKDW